MSQATERRFFGRTEIRAQASGRMISGTAARFNTPADIGGAWIERIMPGAFARAIRERQNVAPAAEPQRLSDIRPRVQRRAGTKGEFGWPGVQVRRREDIARR